MPSKNVSIPTPKILQMKTAGKVRLQGRFRKTGNPCSAIFFFGGHRRSCLLHLWPAKAMQFEEGEKLMSFGREKKHNTSLILIRTEVNAYYNVWRPPVFRLS